MLPTKRFLILSFQLLVVLGNYYYTTSDGETISSTVDRIGLLSFKSQITTAKEKSYVFTSWNDSTETCNWFGISCDAPLHPDRVTSLTLPSFDLTGTISPHLSNLSFLRKIDLGYNNLGGDIPSEIANLHRLQILNLTSNSFHGEIPGALFTNLPELRILMLGGNRLHGKIPRNFTQVSKLEFLNLKDNNLTGAIPSDWGSFTNLQLLSLRKNNLSGEIPPSIGNITTLYYLFLSENNLVGGIPSQLSSCINLTTLDLFGNQLSGQIPPSLFNFSSLYAFSVGNNLLNGTLPSDFGRNLPQLGYLYLYNNNFVGQIPPSLSEATELERIELSGNRFNGSIPPNLGTSLPRLSKLILGNNLLSTDDWRFVQSLTNCKYLEELDLSNNTFTGVLPESITKLSNTTLTWLRLRNNKIMGEIPVMIGDLTSLVTLNLENNNFTGSIPESIGRLKNLKAFSMTNNKFSGSIPDSFGNLTEMLELYMGANELSGTLHPNLAAMNKLIVMDLSHNNLTGVVPKGLLGISTIASFLNISHNNLVGVLPNEVGRLTNLQSFDASHNRFHGRIPESIGNCVLLESLMLQGNKFNGSIPDRIENLKGLHRLDLSDNHLSGSIPSYMENMTSLQYLNLSYNDLEGKVSTKGIFSQPHLFSIQGNKELFENHHHSKLSKRNTVVLVVVITILCFIGLFLFLVYKYKVLPMKKDTKRRKSRYHMKLPRSVSWRENQFFKISYSDIQKATDNFSPTNLIGSGGFGSVYKGTMTINHPTNSKLDIAVKVCIIGSLINSYSMTSDLYPSIILQVLNKKLREISKSFMAECNVLRNVRHRNLVRVLTACSSEDLNGNEFKALVYEFMPNSSLDKWLNNGAMSLLQRLNIAIDVASALDYLHTQTETTIVHCDLKPSNILLDANMVAHVSDFGIAKFLSSDHDQTLTMDIQGSIGYIAPGNHTHTYIIYIT